MHDFSLIVSLAVSLSLSVCRMSCAKTSHLICPRWFVTSFVEKDQMGDPPSPTRTRKKTKITYLRRRCLLLFPRQPLLVKSLRLPPVHLGCLRKSQKFSISPSWSICLTVVLTPAQCWLMITQSSSLALVTSFLVFTALSGMWTLELGDNWEMSGLVRWPAMRQTLDSGSHLPRGGGLIV